MTLALVYVFAIFAVFVAFNIYIRVKTFRYYKQLVEHRIQFQFNDLFKSSRWKEVLDRYPSHQVLLNQFRKHMLSTGLLFILVIVVVLILLFLMRNLH